MERKQLTIFIDGSCYWKIRKGGCGIYIQHKEEEYFLQKGYSNTTISRCELRAFLIAIESLSETQPMNVTIWSDSQYVVEGMKKLFQYIQDDWEGCSNVDLWKKVVEELNKRKKMRLRLNWHKGHDKDLSDPIVYGNAVADVLANYKNFIDYEQDLE